MTMSDDPMSDPAQRSQLDRLLVRVAAHAPIRTAVVHPCDAVSLRGAMVVRPEGFVGEAGKLFRLDLRLENGPIIAMGVKLVRAGERELAFACHKVDLDSFTALKRMIELNLGSTSALNRELALFGE